MKSKKALALDIIGTIIIILGCFASLAFGFGQGNTVFMIVGLIISLAFGMLLLGFAEIIDMLYVSTSNQRKIYDLLMETMHNDEDDIVKEES